MTIVDRTLMCLACGPVLAVDMSGDAREAVDELLPLAGRNSISCPRCHARSIIVLAGYAFAVGRDTPPTVSAAQYLRAHYGVSAPGDLEPTLENVRTALLGQPLRRVALESTPASGVVINSLELWDGTTIHLGRGADGATVYRISTPQSSILKDPT